MSSSSTDEEDDATNPTNHDALQAVTPEQFHTFAMCLKLVVTTAVNSAMNSILLQAMNKIDATEESMELDPPIGDDGSAGTSLQSLQQLSSKFLRSVLDGNKDRSKSNKVQPDDISDGIRNSNLGSIPTSSDQDSMDSGFPVRKIHEKQPFEPQKITDLPPDSNAIDKVWPNGDINYIVTQKDFIPGSMKPYIGYAICQYTTDKSKKQGVTTRKFYCLGVFQCPAKGCQFVSRPGTPWHIFCGSEPRPPRRSLCVHHPNLELEWIPCNGGRVETKNGTWPCLITVKTNGGMVNVCHQGIHNHKRPPVASPSPAAQEAFKTIVRNNPELTARKLMVGSQGRPAVDTLDDAYADASRVYRERKKLLHPLEDKAPIGVRSGMAALLQLLEDIKGAHKEDFLLDFKLTGNVKIITLQSNYMKTVLHEHSSSLQSDTMEGVILEPDWNGSMSIHFTSQYDQVIQRWVPVLASIIFGRTKADYALHWKTLLGLYPANTWGDFASVFPGVTVDWSDALGSSFLDAMGDLFPNASEEDTLSFIKKCDVHFKRSASKAVVREVVQEVASKRDS